MPPNSQNIPSQLLEARRCWKMLFHLNTALNEGQVRRMRGMRKTSHLKDLSSYFVTGEM
ncbi:hypothetical protein PGB90_010668 [Kerria lacca]